MNNWKKSQKKRKQVEMKINNLTDEEKITNLKGVSNPGFLGNENTRFLKDALELLYYFNGELDKVNDFFMYNKGILSLEDIKKKFLKREGDINILYAEFMKMLGKLDSNKIMERLIKILRLMLRVDKEIEALNACITDLDKWSVYMQRGNDITFFIKRFKDYFTGFFLENTNAFVALDRFGDRHLKIALDQNHEINYLINMPGISSRLQYWIDYLYMDIDKNTNRWEKNVSTKKFFENIKSIAAEFNNDYWSQETYELLLKNITIGENPFSWIEVLQKEKEDISGQFFVRRSKAIEEAMKSLLSIFRGRVITLNEGLKKVIIDFFETIEMELKKLFDEKKKEFKRIKNNLELLYVPIVTSITSVLEEIELEKEAQELTSNYQKLIDYSEYGSKLGKSVDPSNYKNFGSIVLFAFVLKKYEGILKMINDIFERSKIKEEKSKNLDITEIKLLVWKCMDRYKRLIKILISIGAPTFFRKKIDLIRKFEVDYYG